MSRWWLLLAAGVMLDIGCENKDKSEGTETARPSWMPRPWFGTDVAGGSGDTGGGGGRDGGSGGVAANTHEAIIQEMLGSMQRLTNAVKNVKDQATAKSAASTFNKETAKVRELIPKAKPLPKLSEAEKKRMQEKLERRIQEVSLEFETETQNFTLRAIGQEYALEVTQAMLGYGLAMQELGQIMERLWGWHL